MREIMNLFEAYIIILMIKSSISHFLRHKDFQKVGEVIFNNEEYRILKPVTHYVTDHLKDFMLRRDNANFPTKRLFIDDNNFRHYWSGFDETKSRKTDMTSTHFENREENVAIIAKYTPKSNKIKLMDINSGRIEDLIHIASIEDGKKDELYEIRKFTNKDSTTSHPEDADIEMITHRTVKNKGKLKHYKTAPKVNLRAGSTTVAPKNDNERTIAKTTFYCPFLGLVTMSSFID